MIKPGSTLIHETTREAYTVQPDNNGHGFLVVSDDHSKLDRVRFNKETTLGKEFAGKCGYYLLINE